MTSTSLHRSAAAGFAQGADGDARNRPDCPTAAVGWLPMRSRSMKRQRRSTFGAGDSKFLPNLLATGARVIAIEPVAAMRERRAAAYPQVAALDGTADAMPLADASAGAVVCATAFHWFATRAALTDIHRVPKPGGRLGLVWNDAGSLRAAPAPDTAECCGSQFGS